MWGISACLVAQGRHLASKQIWSSEGWNFRHQFQSSETCPPIKNGIGLTRELAQTWGHPIPPSLSHLENNTSDPGYNYTFDAMLQDGRSTTDQVFQSPFHFFPPLATQRHSFCFHFLKRERIRSVNYHPIVYRSSNPSHSLASRYPSWPFNRDVSLYIFYWLSFVRCLGFGTWVRIRLFDRIAGGSGV